MGVLQYPGWFDFIFTGLIINRGFQTVVLLETPIVFKVSATECQCCSPPKPTFISRYHEFFLSRAPIMTFINALLLLVESSWLLEVHLNKVSSPSYSQRLLEALHYSSSQPKDYSSTRI